MAGENRDLREIVILIKGAGEMATGVAHRLFRSGFRLCLTEIAEPLAVRRSVSFCEAVFEKEKTVEGVTARLVQGKDAILRAWGEGWIPVVIDPVAAIGRSIHPHVIIDAILAKKNTGTSMTEAPVVIGLGPGFRAGGDVHLVVETNRGHNLGRVIERGEAEPDTGIPGDIRGYTTERVLRAPAQGRIRTKKQIGDSVEAGEVVAEIDGMPIRTKISGVLRGILRDGTHVQEKMKTGDIDPRGARESCFTISEKARAIGGGVLEAILMRYNR